MTEKVVCLARSFARLSDEPVRLLEEAGFEVVRHPNHQVDDERVVADLVGDAAACIVGSDRISGYVLEHCPNLRVVSKHGAGLDNVDLTAARARGVQVFNTPGANAESTAELAWLLLMAANRNLWADVSGFKASHGAYTATRLNHDLLGRTLGIVGFGQIGRILARIARGFQMEVLALDPVQPLGLQTDEMAGEVEVVTADELWARSDYISLHAPAIPSTLRIVNSESIAKMKDGVVIVNAARGGLVDEEALYAGLVSGKVGAAGLDCFQVEPPIGNPLLDLPNVIASPHVGGQSIESSLKLGLAAARNVLDAFRN